MAIFPTSQTPLHSNKAKWLIQGYVHAWAPSHSRSRLLEQASFTISPASHYIFFFSSRVSDRTLREYEPAPPIIVTTLYINDQNDISRPSPSQPPPLRRRARIDCGYFSIWLLYIYIIPDINFTEEAGSYMFGIAIMDRNRAKGIMVGKARQAW